MNITPKGADDFAALASGDPAAALQQFGSVKWSPDFDAYASGLIEVSQVRCILCGLSPCDCPPTFSPEYFALLDKLHGRNPS